MKTRIPSILFAILVVMAASSQAQTVFTWGSATTGGTWSTSTNWSPNGVPSTLDTAVLDTVTSGTRSVTYDSAASGVLATLTMNQTAAAVNELSIQKNLTIANISLGASGGGTSRIYIPLSTAGLTMSGTLSLNSGGVLELASTTTGGPTVSANVVINGGTLNVERSAAASGGVVNTVSTLTMHSGSIVVGSTPLINTGASNDNRLYVQNNFTADGGTIAIGSPLTANQASFYLLGTTNSLVGLSSYDKKVQMTLAKDGDQSLTVGSTPLGTLVLRANISGTATKTISVGSGTTVDAIQMLAQGAGGTTTLLLGSNLATTGAASTTVSALTFSQGLGSTLGINTGTSTGYTLDATSMTGGFVPNNGGTNVVTWVLNGNGTIKATSFDFSQTTNGTTVSGSVTLQATGTNANVLSSNGGRTIAPTSTFLYTGSSATVTSTRALGRLAIGDGTNASTLSGSGTLTVASDVTVNNNATLNLAGNNLVETGSGSGVGGLNGSGTVLNNTTATAQTLTLDTTGGNGSFSGVIKDHTSGTGTVALIKQGNGTQTLSGSNSYTGSTAINGGTLAVNGSISASATTVNTGGILTGSGTTGGVTVSAGGKIAGTLTTGALTVNSGGTIAPGNSPGIINSGNFSLSGTLSADVGKPVTPSGSQPVAGTDYDQVNVTGTVTLTGADLTLTIGIGTIQIGDIYFLIKNDSTDAVSGTFATLNGASTNLSEGQTFTASGQQFKITYQANAEGGTPSFTGGNDVALLAVPEPSTFAMALGGFGILIGLQGLRRRK